MSMRIFNNWSLLTTSNLLGQFFGMLATIILTRQLQPDGYGQYALFMTYASIASVIASLGMRNVMIAQIARNPDRTRAYMRQVAICQLLMSIPVVLAIFLYLDSRYPLIAEPVVGLLYCILLWKLVEGVAIGHQFFFVPAAFNLGERLLWLVVVFLLPKHSFSLGTIIFIYVMLQLLKALSAAVALRKREMIAITGKADSLDLLYRSLPIYWVSLLTLSTSHLPILFLSINAGSSEVGFYAASEKLIQPLQMMILTLMTVLIPSLSAIRDDREKFNQLLKNAIVFLVVVNAAAAAAVSMLSAEIVTLIFGVQYRASANVLSAQVWYTSIFAIFNLLGTSFLAVGKEKLLGLLATGSAMVNLPIIWFASRYGATGVAVGMLIAGSLNMIYHWPILQSVHGRPVATGLAFSLLLLTIALMTTSIFLAADSQLLVRIAISIILSVITGIYLLRAYRGRLKVGNS